MLNDPVIHFGPPSNLLLINMGKINGGNHSVLRRVPDETPGIYAFYRSLSITEEPEAAMHDILRNIEAKKFADRSGNIGPIYNVTIKSHTSISDGKKRALIKALARPKFRATLQHTLSLSILFQTPLYIGKASNLRARIEQHLNEGSELSVRLGEVGVVIRSASLLLFPLDDDNAGDEADEELHEEIFSRLFNPLFTLRYG